MLKLRDGWQAFTTEHGDTYLYSPDKPTTSWNYHVDIDADMVAAFPHGGLQCRVFDTIEEAHAYLLSVGSESPWEESC
jgi:hypothetical protein